MTIKTKAERVLLTEQGVRLDLTLKDAKIVERVLAEARHTFDRPNTDRIRGELNSAINSCSEA